jgi:hypothetical protein
VNKPGGCFALSDAADLVGHNLIEKDHELRRRGLRAFSGQIPPDIALIPRFPADTVPRACRPSEDLT